MKETLHPNAIKIGFNENEFVVSFGEMDDDEQVKNEVDLVLPPEKVMSVISSLFRTVVDYQEMYEKNIGLKKQGENDE